MSAPAEETESADTPHALYRLYDAEDVLLYIGISWHPSRRMDGHASDKDWWLDVAHGTMRMYPSEMDARKAEAEAIDLENPLHNDVRPAVGPVAPPHGQRKGWHRNKGITWHSDDPTLKPRLKAEAERRGITLGALLDEMATEYLAVRETTETTTEGDPR